MSEDGDAGSIKHRRTTVAGRRRLSSPSSPAVLPGSDFEDFEVTQPPPSMSAAGDDSEERTTEELYVAPKEATKVDDERTEPRIRAPESEDADRDSDAGEPTKPRIYVPGLGLAGEESAEPTTSIPVPAVVIARARIISDMPPRPAPSESEDVGLQLEDVDVADEDAQSATGPQSGHGPASAKSQSSVTPPPAPPKGVAKPPPPPQAPVKHEEKRVQTRQWWERFFSDDYLATVAALTPTQITRQVDFIESSLALSKGGTVLDVGCGLGAHAIELTRRGYLVVGLDLSLAMITRAAETAQQMGLKVNLVHADIRELEFDGAFDAVMCMGTTFGFFEDDANRDVLKRLHNALKPGGRLLLETVNRDYVLRFQPNLVWFEGQQCVCMEESDFNYFNSRLSVKRTMMRDDGRQTQADYSVRLYALHELGQMLHQLAFRVIEVSGQEALRGVFLGANSPRMLITAERRPPGRPSVVMPPERTTGEVGKPPPAISAERLSTAVPRPPPPERGSAEIPKPKGGS